jgi:hypothetical protein
MSRRTTSRCSFLPGCPGVDDPPGPQSHSWDAMGAAGYVLTDTVQNLRCPAASRTRGGAAAHVRKCAPTPGPEHFFDTVAHVWSRWADVSVQGWGIKLALSLLRSLLLVAEQR